MLWSSVWSTWINISNNDSTRNADGVLSRREVDIPVDWIGENSQRFAPQKFKTSY